MLPGEHGSGSLLLLATLGEHGFCSLGSVAPAPHSCEWGCYSPLLGCMVFVTWFQLLREYSFSTFPHAFVDFYIIYNSCSLPLSFVVSPELEAWEHELFLSPFILYESPFTPFAHLVEAPSLWLSFSLINVFSFLFSFFEISMSSNSENNSNSFHYDYFEDDNDYYHISAD